MLIDCGHMLINILFQDNIVIYAEGSPKICNSGIFSILNEPDGTCMARAASRWMAIEMAQAMDAPICYSKKADVWAFGMTLYVCRFHRYLFHTLTCLIGTSK